MMTNPIQTVKNQIKTLMETSYNVCVDSGIFEKVDIPNYSVEIPNDTSHGDFATNFALVFSKALKTNPREIATNLIENANFENSFIEKAEIAGPGFINFFLSTSYYSSVLKQIIAAGDKYGRVNVGNGKRVLVEFVSANPTGPMHIGNARGGALGDCLASILDYAGYYTEREFYVNDAGNQIEKFAISLNVRYLQLFKDGIEMPEDAYQGDDIKEHVKNFAEINGDKYVNESEEVRKKALVDYALPINIQNLENDLLKYRIKYNTWYRESSIHQSGDIEKIINILKEKGYTYEKEGALWFKATEFGCDKDFVLIRSNGFPTYIVPDIAYHYNKLVTRNFDLAINVLGADHHGYVPRLKAALSALDIDADRLNVILMQMVRLIRDGDVIKASKRSGKAITLVTLLDEVPIDAARFHFNLREANSHFDFDLDLATKQSNQNPVYYVQYAHARICSIIKALAADNVTFDKNANLDLLTNPDEKSLIKALASFGEEITISAATFDPSRMTRYIIEVATAFHKFYNSCKIKGESMDIAKARLYLAYCTKTVIANVLTMLSITVPESM